MVFQILFIASSREEGKKRKLHRRRRKTIRLITINYNSKKTKSIRIREKEKRNRSNSIRINPFIRRKVKKSFKIPVNVVCFFDLVCSLCSFKSSHISDENDCYDDDYDDGVDDVRFVVELRFDPYRLISTMIIHYCHRRLANQHQHRNR